MDSGTPCWSLWTLQAHLPVFHPPSPTPLPSRLRDGGAWVPLGRAQARASTSAQSPQVREKSKPEGWGGVPPVLQGFPTTPLPGTQPLRAVEPPVPLRDVPGQSRGLRVLGGGTRAPRAEQSRGVMLGLAGEAEGPDILPSKRGGASWDLTSPASWTGVATGPGYPCLIL